MIYFPLEYAENRDSLRVVLVQALQSQVMIRHPPSNTEGFKVALVTGTDISTVVFLYHEK